MKKFLALSLSLVIGSVSLPAANIYWVSFHSGDNTPSAGAAGAGFTQAPDIGYTTALQNAGHTVTRYVSTGTPNVALLNTADLIIISRSVGSGDYDADAETAAWNSITAPTMIMGGYLLRNNRLGYTTGTGIPDTAGPVRLSVLNPTHQIFSGIALDTFNTMLNNYALSGTNGSITFTNNPQRGISVNTNPVAGGGTVLARVAAGDTNVAGGMIIAEWQAGATMGTTPADTLGGRRLVFLSGTRELLISSEGSGIYDLTPDGLMMFNNAVNYMAVPEPSSMLLGGLAVAGFLFYQRRRK